MNETEFIIVLGETYQPGTGGRSIQWHKTFCCVEDFLDWVNSRTLDWDDSYEVFAGCKQYHSVSHGSRRQEDV